MSPNRIPFTTQRQAAPWAGVAALAAVANLAAVAGLQLARDDGAAPMGQQVADGGCVNTASPRPTAL